MTIGPLLSRPSLRGIEARAGIESFAHHLCSALGLPQITVVWTPGMSTAAINQRGDMHLSDLGDSSVVTRSTLSRYAGFVLHELLHRKWTDFSVRDFRPYVDRLHNALEDAWIERKAIRSGLTGNVTGLLHSLIAGMVAECKAQPIDWSDPAQLPFSLAIHARGYGVTVPTPAVVLPIWAEASRRLDFCLSSADTLKVAEWVFDQLKLQQDQGNQGDAPEDKPADQSGDQSGDQDGDQDGDQEGGQDGTQAGDKDGDEGPQEGPGSAQDQSEGDGQGSGKGEESEPSDAGPISGEIDENTQARPVEPTLENDRGAPGGTYTREQVLKTKISSIGETWGGDAKVPPALRHQVRRLFENSAREWREGGFKSGTLHRPALVKVPTGAREVFARRFSQDGVDSAVAILLDVSMSMCGALTFFSGSDDRRKALAKGSNMDIAAGACLALIDTLAQAGAESMVLAFGRHSHVVKPFGMPWRKAVPIIRSVGLQGDTNDFAACRFATEALMAHPAERKVMIAISDGCGEKARTSKQVQAAKDLGIQVIGIGVQYDVSETWGDESVKINSVQDLGTVAFSRLKAAA